MRSRFFDLYQSEDSIFSHSRSRKVNRVVLKRQLMALIWAGIVVLLAQYSAGAAQAHEDGGHATPRGAELSRDVGGYSDVAYSDGHEMASAVASCNPVSAPLGPCTSACGTGSSCCGGAVVFGSTALPDCCRTRPPAGSRWFSILLGTNPEALPKPPRSIV